MGRAAINDTGERCKWCEGRRKEVQNGRGQYPVEERAEVAWNACYGTSRIILVGGRAVTVGEDSQLGVGLINLLDQTSW